MNKMKLLTSLKWLWNISRGVRLRSAWLSVVGMLYIGAVLSFVWICKRLVDLATGVAEGDILPMVGVLIACVVTEILLSALTLRLETMTVVRFQNNIRHRIFSQVLSSKWAGRENLHTGDIINRMETDVQQVATLICKSVPLVLVTFFQLVAAFIFLMRLDARLAWVLLCIMPLAIVVGKIYLKKGRELTRSIREMDSKVQSHVQENLQNRLLVRTMERTGDVVNTMGFLQGSLFKLESTRSYISLFSRASLQFGFMAGYVTTFVWGVYGIRSGLVTFGMMTAFLQLVAQVQRPVVQLSQEVPGFIRALTAAERLEELLSMELEPQGEPVRLSGGVGVTMESVSFTYPDGSRKILDGFTHDFQPGSLTAVVGETGAGKSTMMRLILALLEPDEGTVAFYDAETKVAASPQTRCNVVYVPQGNTLMSGTIRQNLLMGRPEATEEEMREALHTAAADFVFDLPEGLDALCGERGTGLSEGQAQRIAVARGLLRSGGLLLLDEPTASLDAETEMLLLKRISDNLNGRTVILITHREAAADLCQCEVRL
ncbi:MAG: ABC transporter ATP-binding protein/permease [Paludibacteraceae bacterium]|nr:ABC transporter ATP-binding protein/permease [Paludibacteraceae bacterium]